MNNDPEEVLLGRLTAELELLDAQYDDIPLPSLQELEESITAETLRRQRRSRKELLLFWCVSLIPISFVLTAAGYAPAIFWVLQGIFPITALGVLGAARIRLRRRDAEE